MNSIGVVAIGRNEGERLIRCLNSLIAQLPAGTPIVYVDSGSTDGSVAAAQALGVQVVELDMTIPFTMARGRNAGFRYLIEHCPEIQYVQFIDGDCELIEGWIEQAVSFLDSNPQLAIVTGRRIERYPEASIYNLLADLEWNTPVGEATECGGDILARASAIREVNGYNESLIAGEEPDMCMRLRQKGWKIWRIDVKMTLHDAAMTRFSQWWKRSVRGGWAAAAGAAMHGRSPEKFRVKECRSGWLWGAIVPSLAIGLVPITQGFSLMLLLGYPYQMWRIYRYRRNFGDQPAAARIYSRFCVLSKFPQAIGQFKYWLQRWQGKQATLIEYKAAPQVAKYQAEV
ncbi:glycosyltransferase [Leptolyngbya sp. FACHB-711]|uniref:glycosyltransferase family 2 protein n=1 Tax=unclassified Leptolyngbya TaxID=2650499 RepID=UPI0016890936|nr:glycosyltransferase [Leptolyngbya sp. FACHB-711]MBD1850486.1 glycosyltransferase [Cyanobacteria bacterium FACHB-502]MBD2027787.1 glycosyltransferase [Leptolyngbya sp. FACHB-711]